MPTCRISLCSASEVLYECEQISSFWIIADVSCDRVRFLDGERPLGESRTPHALRCFLAWSHENGEHLLAAHFV